ncbi:hypothetical protein HYW17_00120 [Candidatus Uhrbacteria bacterium]|nr:hypothetical protein [Candidatus Uhrbacteria bacterium]
MPEKPRPEPKIVEEDALTESLRKAKAEVPKGEFHAWANPDVRIPRQHVQEVWEQEVDDLLDTEADEEKREKCKEAIRKAVLELGGPREYFSLMGYGNFEARLFRKEYWQRFTRAFPAVAPHLEHLRTKVRALIRMEFQPEVIQGAEQYLKAAGYPDWTPNFFKRHADPQARSLHTWVRNHVRGFDGRSNWPMFVERLSEQARSKFSMHEVSEPIPGEQLIPTLITTLCDVLKRNDYWTPYSLMLEHKVLYERLRKHYRTPAKRPDRGDVSESASRPNWPAILKELPEELRGKFRWGFGREFKYRDEADAVREFEEVLTQWQPPKWGPRWLEENGFPALRQYWESHFRTSDGGIDWKRLLNQLPANLREGFIMDPWKKFNT